jgi:hypothetical protein
MLAVNYNKLGENINSLISDFQQFANIHLYSVHFENLWFIGIRILLV